MKTLILTITATGVVAGLQVWQRGAALFPDDAELQKETGCSTLGQIVENRLQSLSHFDIVHL